MTSETDRSRWWFALRGGAAFFLGGGLGTFAYRMFSNRSAIALPWGWLLFGAVVTASLSGLVAGRRRG